MDSAIWWDPTGRPWAQCPLCGKHHSISRRKDYLAKPVLRFQCRNPQCRSVTWRTTPEERDQLVAYFDSTAGRGVGRPQVRPKPEPETVPAKDPEPQEPPKEPKPSIWDKLF